MNMGPRVGFSALISCGNEAVTTVGDYLRYFAHDDETRAVTLFLEGFRDPTGFVEGARALRSAGKPLAILKAGRDDQASTAVAAHSGSLAGSEEVVRGLLHQLGAIGVDDLDELFEVAELLAHGKLPRGRRLFVITDSGGEANLVADHSRMLGLELGGHAREHLRETRGEVLAKRRVRGDMDHELGVPALRAARLGQGLDQALGEFAELRLQRTGPAEVAIDFGSRSLGSPNPFLAPA